MSSLDLSFDQIRVYSTETSYASALARERPRLGAGHPSKYCQVSTQPTPTRNTVGRKIKRLYLTNLFE